MQSAELVGVDTFTSTPRALFSVEIRQSIRNTNKLTVYVHSIK